MLRLDFLLIDVFSDQPFGGSRLTLFPDAAGVKPDLMHKLAREMGPGETAFVLAGPDRSEPRAPLRVFTPQVEIPFAGHAMLGGVFALDRLGRLPGNEEERTFTWQLEAGDFRVLCRGGNENAVYSLRQDAPVFLGAYYHRAKVARALGLEESDIAITGLPCEIISTGLPIHVVPVGSLEAVRRSSLRRREADVIACDLGFGDLFLFTCETENPEAAVHCRMFAPHFGIPEDPASGAAHGALAAYLVKHRLVRGGDRLSFLSEQGLEMGRPSRLFVEARIQDGVAADIQVGGRCVLVGEGRVALP